MTSQFLKTVSSQAKENFFLGNPVLEVFDASEAFVRNFYHSATFFVCNDMSQKGVGSHDYPTVSLLSVNYHTSMGKIGEFFTVAFTVWYSEFSFC